MTTPEAMQWKDDRESKWVRTDAQLTVNGSSVGESGPFSVLAEAAKADRRRHKFEWLLANVGAFAEIGTSAQQQAKFASDYYDACVKECEQ